MIMISSISASNKLIESLSTNNNDSETISINLSVSNLSDNENDIETPDIPDLVVNDTIYITSEDIDDYFPNGELESKYVNKTLIFAGNFLGVGKLTINVNNVTLKGAGSYLKNTVFDLRADNIKLDSFTIDLDEEFENNDGAAIQFIANNIILSNLKINYIVPRNVGAYAIYGVGNPNNKIKNFKMINSFINFEGRNDYVNKYNCAVKLLDCLDSIMENNSLITALPLRNVNFGAMGASLDSDYVLSVGVENCHNFKFIGNSIISSVNNRPSFTYPTLDCFLISKCDNSSILNNSIYMTDFLTFPGVENYLYGIDIYNLNNLTIAYNNISIITTGGRLAAGTAYPIQITGPIFAVNITYNDIYTFSNGPNIGIYSQNYYGKTALSITNNRINVTGLAGSHEWALVAGIETQDSNSTIQNNTIEVHSVAPVNIGDNIYGISYRQKTSGNHSYNIQNNTVFSDGFYSVYLLSSVNSTVINNLLVSFNEKVKKSLNGFNYNDFGSHSKINFYNNKVINAWDYFADKNNNIDGGEDFNYTTPTNNNKISNHIDGSSIIAIPNSNHYHYNPLIPGNSNNQGNTQNPNNQGSQFDSGNSGGNSTQGNSGTGNNVGDGNSSGNKLSLRDLLANFFNSNSDNGKTNKSSFNSNAKDDVSSNNTDQNPSTEGEDALMSDIKSIESPNESPSASNSVSKKVYELDDLTKENKLFIPSVIFIVVILIFILVGYRRKNKNFE